MVANTAFLSHLPQTLIHKGQYGLNLVVEDISLQNVLWTMNWLPPDSFGMSGGVCRAVDNVSAMICPARHSLILTFHQSSQRLKLYLQRQEQVPFSPRSRHQRVSALGCR